MDKHTKRKTEKGTNGQKQAFLFLLKQQLNKNTKRGLNKKTNGWTGWFNTQMHREKWELIYKENFGSIIMQGKFYVINFPFISN